MLNIKSIMILLISTLLFSNERVYTDNELFMKENLVYEKKTNTLINGLRVAHYKSGAIKFKYPYVKGKLDGLAIMYYKSGRVEYETPYTSGKVNGVKRGYYKSGKKWFEVKVENDKALFGYVYKPSGRKKDMTKKEFKKLGLL